MQEYMLSVHHDGDFPAPDPEVMQQMFADVEAFNESLRQTGAWVFAGGLLPKDTASTVRYQSGAAQVVDGPWSDSKEQLGGFWVIQAEDLDAALRIAEQGAVACRGDVEVRRFQGE
jgi:hypothetical protein